MKKIKDSDLSLLKEYYSEKQPNKKMELRSKLKEMGFKEGISGVNSRELMWVELNGKRYEVKNGNRVSALDSLNKYKINNCIITANSPVEAMKIYKLMDGIKDTVSKEDVIKVAKSRQFELKNQSKNYLTFIYKGEEEDRNYNIEEILKILPSNMSADWDKSNLEIAIRDSAIKDDEDLNKVMRAESNYKTIDSMKDRVPDDVVRKYQNIVDRAIALYGRIGAGLYDDLDQAGLWVDDRSNKYIVKRKVEDSTKDADWSKARYKKFNQGDRIKFKTLNKYIRTGIVEKDEGSQVIVRTDDFNSLERVQKYNIYDVIVFDSSKDSDIDYLSSEEEKAINDYKNVIQNTTNPKLLELYKHILEEEIEHYNELNEAKTEDSIKDSYDKSIVMSNAKAYANSIESRFGFKLKEVKYLGQDKADMIFLYEDGKD